jgi:hypothetical protein
MKEEYFWTATSNTLGLRVARKETDEDEGLSNLLAAEKTTDKR